MVTSWTQDLPLTSLGFILKWDPELILGEISKHLISVFCPSIIVTIWHLPSHILISLQPLSWGRSVLKFTCTNTYLNDKSLPYSEYLNLTQRWCLKDSQSFIIFTLTSALAPWVNFAFTPSLPLALGIQLANCCQQGLGLCFGFWGFFWFVCFEPSLPLYYQ